MCGIMGYAGVLPAAPIIIKGLQCLEYRGYDSAGLGVISNGKIDVFKSKGSPENLLKFAENNEISDNANLGIGHTRWATHGEPNETNAHPHLSGNGMFCVVHNGIIENFSALKKELEGQGVRFKSETDTEVVAHLLEREYKGDVKSAIKAVLPLLQGTYALGILCSDYPDSIFCAKYSSPLFMCVSPDGGYIASDVSALPCNSGKIYKLGDREIGIITKDELRVFDVDGCRIRKTEIKLKDADTLQGKGEFEHYMLKEIFEQPSAVEDTLNSIIIDGKIKLPTLKMTKEKIKKINRVEFIACGSAYHAGTVGAYIAQTLMGVSSEAYIASEYRYKKQISNENTLCVIISQSGETADTLAALYEAKKRGAKVVSVINAPLSTIAQESSGVILTKAKKEVAVATTKAFSAQLAVIYCLCVKLSYSSGKISKARYEELISQMKKIPEKLQELLKDFKKYSEIAREIETESYVCFIGRGVDYCSSLEGALKLKEVSYTHCEAYPAGELKHGTISLLEKGTPVISLITQKALSGKTKSNVLECKARGAKIICITNEENLTLDADDTIIKIPDIEDLFSTSLSVVPMQLIAYFTALHKGCSIDKPKNLAKSVTVE